MRLYHTTDAAAEILAGGFRDNEGSYMLVGHTVRGVFLARWPADINDGATGDQVLEVAFPEEVDLTDYAFVVDDGPPQWEWCVPAELINSRATTRRLTEDELVELLDARFGPLDEVE